MLLTFYFSTYIIKSFFYIYYKNRPVAVWSLIGRLRTKRHPGVDERCVSPCSHCPTCSMSVGLLARRRRRVDLSAFLWLWWWRGANGNL